MERISENFWNFRGAFRIAGLFDIGTQMSLVRRPSGRFIVLDSYDLNEADLAAFMELTGQGCAVEAIINVHPFHTVHCETLHRLLPEARLIGTRRHKQRHSRLPWDGGFIEDSDTQAEFGPDLQFSVPAGLELIPRNENVHASSVLVRHRESRVIHVDDTLNAFAFPRMLRAIAPRPRLRFHPLLGKALQQRAGAADAFAAWARELAGSWVDTRVVCTAHSSVVRLNETTFADEMLSALRAVKPTLAKHRERFG